METTNIEVKVPVMADLFAEGKKPEYLFWVGSAGAFDDRYKKVTQAFVKILTYLEIDYAVLGAEESSSGDVARRAGNEMLFQMQALMNIELLEGYEVKKITYHDPCYLGRANGEYNAPRKVVGAVTADFVEMKRSKSFALCCGAGGGQMFKEAEKGNKEVFIERTEDALETGADVIATACPYCMVMMTDGLKYKNKNEKIKNYDIAELVAMS